MALIVADRVAETSTTTGTGALTLAAALTGFQRFSAACSTSDTLYYVIIAVDGNGNPSGDWECGLGTYSSANTLTRTTPQASTNSGSAVNFGAGTKYVFLEATAAYLATAYRVGGTDVAVTDGGTGSSTAAGACTNLGLGTGDSPQFTAVNIGHASDTTVTRTGAGDIAVEGNALYRAGGTDVPVTDGGTGSSTASGARTNLGLGTAATQTTGTFAQVANNLSDLASAATARTNLGLLRLIAAFFTTTPTSSEVLAIYIAADAFTLAANLSGSQVSVGTNPSATFAIDVQKNGSTIGTISISTGGTPTLTTTSGTSKAIAAADIIKLVAPSSADSTIANVAINLKGTL